MFIVSLPENKLDREAAISDLSWMMRGFLENVSNARRKEAISICNTILKQLRPYVNDKEYEALSYRIRKEHDHE